MLIAIHQPNFFPWLGYFDKIRRADMLILLDAVDYPRAGSGGMGSWCNRVKLAIQGEARWVTCPLRRLASGAPILAAEIDDGQQWRKRLIKTLESSYRRAAHYDSAMTLLVPLIEHPESNLATFNILAIEAIAGHLGLSGRLRRQSTIAHSGVSTERLISLVEAVGGTAYLAGGGAGGYQEDTLFRGHGIDLVYQGFIPHTYGPPAAFLPGLSVIDYLMHDGRPLAEAFPDRAT